MILDRRIAAKQAEVARFTVWWNGVASAAGDAQGVDEALQATWGKDEPAIVRKQRAAKIDKYNGFLIQLLLDKERAEAELNSLLLKQTRLRGLFSLFTRTTTTGEDDGHTI